MRKLTTAFSLLAEGSFAVFFRQIRINARRRQLDRAKGRPFTYCTDLFPFVCVPGLPDSEDAFVSPELDRTELALLCDWLEPGDTFFDVGANLGLYTFCAAHRLGRGSAVLAIEASPVLAKAIRACADVLGLDSIYVEQVAAGDAIKEVVFFSSPSGASTAEQSLNPDPRRAVNYVTQSVHMTTLVEIADRHASAKSPAAIKVDVEGAEPMALRGAPRAWFEPNGPMWIVEMNLSALTRSGSKPEDITAHFPSNSFACWLVPHFPYHGGCELPMRPMQDHETFEDSTFYNFIAIPRSAEWSARHRHIQRHFSAPIFIHP